jgi:hypothetical protein
MFKVKKHFLKDLRQYEKIDKELESYVHGLVNDPFVSDIVFLGGEEADGFAGIDSNGQIHYIWIFRNKRGNNLAGHYCLIFGVVAPTPTIIHCILKKSVNLNPTTKYIRSNYNSLWNVKYGFEVFPIGDNYTGIAYNQYVNGEGIFKKIEDVLPVGFNKIDLDKLENIMGGLIERRNKDLPLSIDIRKILI